MRIRFASLKRPGNEAVQTPQVVLYAMTNPQHTPWKSPHEVLFYPVDEVHRSKSPVLQWVQARWRGDFSIPSAEDILAAVRRLESEKKPAQHSEIENGLNLG